MHSHPAITSHFGLPVSHTQSSCGPEILFLYQTYGEATGLHLLPGSAGSPFHGQLLSMVSTASNKKKVFLMSLEESWLLCTNFNMVL